MPHNHLDVSVNLIPGQSNHELLHKHIQEEVNIAETDAEPIFVVDKVIIHQNQMEINLNVDSSSWKCNDNIIK